MALGTMASSNLVSQAWQNVYEVINSNVSDPKSRSKWIYAAFPASRKGTADVFPCVIIESPSIDAEQFVMGSQKRYIWTIPIEVYDTKMATCDSVSDSVFEQLNSNSGSFTANGMFQPLITAMPTTHTIISGNILHYKRIEVRLEGVI